MSGLSAEDLESLAAEVHPVYCGYEHGGYAGPCGHFVEHFLGPTVAGIVADAWDEGYEAGGDDLFATRNPYRAAESPAPAPGSDHPREGGESVSGAVEAAREPVVVCSYPEPHERHLFERGMAGIPGPVDLTTHYCPGRDA